MRPELKTSSVIRLAWIQKTLTIGNARSFHAPAGDPRRKGCLCFPCAGSQIKGCSSLSRRIRHPPAIRTATAPLSITAYPVRRCPVAKHEDHNVKRYIVICILAFLAGCSSVPNEKQRSTFLKQENFSKNYKLAVLAMWIQPPYQEATALLSEDALMRLEQRLADETGKELPASATPWNGVALHKPAPNRSSIYRRLEQDTPLIKAGGYDGILAVVIEPGVIPRNEMFRAGVKQKDCPPTSYARGPSCPYLVEERLG